MNKYLTKKVIEEAGEVIVEGAKVLLHGNRRRQDFIREQADLMAMLDLSYKRMTEDEQAKFSYWYNARIKRENKKGKA